ncbi:helix-turn-helix domain-containing protein [Pedobacter heparinus]
MQVTQIHYSTGFESNAHFYRQFKKFKGFSPLSYKAQYQKLSNQ